MSVLRLEDPRPRLAPNRPGWRALGAMAFRPLYLAAAIFGALAVLAWVHGFAGSAALPGVLWHGHEMVWGYAGAVVVGFLLTAVATWTGQPAFGGPPLALLVGLWLLARLSAALEAGAPLLTALFSVSFFLASTLALAMPIMRSGNRRNAGLPLLLLAFGAADALYLAAVAGVLELEPQRLLRGGLLLVVGFITVVGLRVIPFFTHRALQGPRFSPPRWAGLIAIGAPLLLALLAIGQRSSPSALPVGMTGMAFNLVLLARCFEPAVLRHPLLWILHAGYAMSALGLGLAGLALSRMPELMPAAVHAIAIGGIGVLTLGMMTRTALGHTGRPLRLPVSMLPAYLSMMAAGLLRFAAAWPGMPWRDVLLPASGACFAAALLLFVARYGRWLASTRADGLPG